MPFMRCLAFDMRARRMWGIPASQRVLNGVGERVAEMERARDVGRGNDHGKAGRLGGRAFKVVILYF